MALVKCHECGNEISSKAKACPKCGVKPKKQVGIVGVTVIAIIGLGIVFSIVASNNAKEVAAELEASKTPEQKAREAADKQKTAAAYSLAALGAKALKNAMKDPSSFVINNALATEKGAVCFKYHSKNSFGAIMPGESVLSPDGKMIDEGAGKAVFVKAYNKHCANQSGYDVTDWAASHM